MYDGAHEGVICVFRWEIFVYLCCRWETFVVVERRTAVVPVPTGVGLDVACLVPCSGITAFGAITNALPVIHETVRHKGAHC